MTIIRDVLVKITADNSGLDKGLNAAQAGLKKFAMAAGAALGAAAASFAAMIPVAARSATEIANFSRVANASTTEFQRWAAGAKTVGVEQEKLADILKDVNDRVGDFLTTGGGPMQDFFEQIAPKVGVTADQFARLSGPEALQLYVDSLEKAGVNQQQMTFYMEAMAGDLTNLLPLLRNGGKEMTALGDAAEKSGRIHTPEMIKAGQQLDRVLGDIADTLKTSATAAVLEHEEELIALANWISDTGIPALGALAEAVGEVAMAFASAITDIVRFGEAAAKALKIATNSEYEGEPSAGQHPDTESSNPDSGFVPSTTGTYTYDEDGNVIIPGDDGEAPVTMETKPKPAPGLGYLPSTKEEKKGGGGGKKRDDIESRLERLQHALDTERELYQEFYEEGQKTLDDAKAANLLSQSEYHAESERLEAEHLDRMKALDRAAMQEKLAGWSQGLGDLASLMSTGNKKMFQIGKAAAIAQAIVDGWSAATSAWDKGMKIGGPPVAAAFTAMSLARTGAMLANLKSAQFDSGGAGGSGGGAGSGGSTPAAHVPTQVNVAWQGDMTPQSVGTLTEKLNREYKQGYRLIFTLGGA